uniref:LisH domain-containing protein ARMC9 n=1 Tax=Meloidogyne hapla TaxID=6305 RepID=A0A1I8BB39_MELHA
MTSMYAQWIVEMTKLAETRERNIKTLKESQPFDEQRLRSLDATLKKVTAFTKKLKNISTSTIYQLLPDLDKLNLSKYLDEIAANICEAKIKIADLNALVDFNVKVSSLYKEFSMYLLNEFKKQMPSKKGDKVENPSKLRVDLRFFTELLLNGIFGREGLQLLGSVLAFLVNTDKQEHLNTSVLMPFCKAHFFPITGILPFSVQKDAKEMREAEQKHAQLISTLFTAEQRSILAKTLDEYWQSLVEHTNRRYVEMNKLKKSIRRQERTRGDASADDRQRFEQTKQHFERLHSSLDELSECLGHPPIELPPEETSDDEKEADAAATRLSAELSEGRVLIWPDRDTQLFYESLLDVTAYTPTIAAQAAEAGLEQQQTKEHIVTDSIENVDLSCLEEQQPQDDESSAPTNLMEVPEEDEISVASGLPAEQGEEQETIYQPPDSSSIITCGDKTVITANFSELLSRLPQSINKDLIDSIAIDFLKNYSRIKSNRKRLVQHLQQPPEGRLDLLPFYARFMATIKAAYPEITTQVLHELLARFRSITTPKSVQFPKKAEMQQALARIEAKLHLCAYLSELCKFGILPKAEALTCLRSLLVHMHVYKVDMLCIMIEQMGSFLYRSPDAHSKMAVIMQVLKDKSANVKDPRHKILLENAYFAVIPPDDQTISSTATRLPPMQEFILHKLSTDIRIGIFRRIDWDDEEIRDFTLKLLSCPWRVHFADMASMASLVSALSDHHDWIGVRVLDAVLEFLRLSLELNAPALQQRALTTVAYFGQLFNYNVTNTATLFKVLYQLISLGIYPITSTTVSDPPQEGNESSGPEQLIIRLQRIRLVTQLVDTVCEFFCAPKSKSTRRMDQFLCFFLKFYYETRDGWSLFIDEIGEFPDDVIQLVTELLRTWRKNEKFPDNLNEAQMRVAEIEAIYKAKVDEILAGMRNAIEAATREAGYTEEGQRRLNRITEENEELEDYDSEDEEEEDSLDGINEESCDNEEEDIEHEERPHSNRKQHKKNSLNNIYDEQPNISSFEQQQSNIEQTCYFDGDESQLRIHTQQKQILPEDEDFMRDFDKTMNESLQPPVMLQGPISDLVVPPQAKQKFERKLTFAMSESHSVDKSSPHDLLPPEDVGGGYGSPQQYLQRQNVKSSSSSPQSRMALMLRATKGFGGSGGTSGSGGIGAKGNVMLKAVNIEDIGDNLTEKWRMAQEEQEKNRREMKKVTLALNERMAQEADEANRQEQIAEMEKRFVFTGGSTSNLGGNE